MSEHEQKGNISRRRFLKLMGAAGATGVIISFPHAVSAGQMSISPSSRAPFAAPTQAKAEDMLASVPKEKLLRTFERMTLSRQWETWMKDYRLSAEKDPMYGGWYPYVGQEAISNGVVLALNDDDYTLATHRSQGAVVAKGLDLNKVAAELLFRSDGQNKGYGGTMHIADPSKGFLGANGIVGGGWPLVAGAAWAGMVRGDKRVAVAFAGDGASNSPYFFNTVRNALLYKIPAIFVIENNQYNGDIAYQACSPVQHLADYVFGLKVPAFTIDGNDVAAVYATAKEAVDRARAGGGPTVIEGITYRWYDHRNFAGTKAGVDGAWGLPYRSDLELKQWMAKDPIPRFKQFLLEKNLATESELTKIEADQKPKIEAAFEFARNSPTVKPEMGLKNLYSDRDLVATQFFNRKGLAT